jgi:hypothetical protein
MILRKVGEHGIREDNFIVWRQKFIKMLILSYDTTRERNVKNSGPNICTNSEF